MACGKLLPIIGVACKGEACEKGMPVLKGMIGNTEVNTLRDTGCSGVVVRKCFVQPDQYTGRVQTCMLIYGTIVKVPIALIKVDTPYMSDNVEAMCMDCPVYDLIIGNVAGARAPDDPDVNWRRTTEACAVTRAGLKKLDKKLEPLHIAEVKGDNNRVTVDKLIELQKQDKELNKVR